MPKYYCDYCDVFLTHDSTSVRKAHNSGRNHLTNVRDYYASMGQDQAQDFINRITEVAERAGGGRPMMGGPGGFGGPPRQWGGRPPMRGPPGPGFQGGPPPHFRGGPPGPGFHQGGPPGPGGFGGPPGGFQGGPGPRGFGGPPPQGGFGGPGPGFGGGMGMPPQQQQQMPPQGQFGAPPMQQQGQPQQPMPQQQQPAGSMSPTAPGLGAQIHPARAAALGLR